MREHDVAGLSARELEQARRDLQVSLSLARPGSPARVPIVAHMAAIDAEIAERKPGIHMCSCGLGTDDPGFLMAHLVRHPDHDERG